MRIVRFIGTFIGNTAGVAAFQIAMTRCCAIFVSLFGGYFLAAYAIDQLGKKLLGREDQYELNQQFVGYSMVVTFVLDIVSGLFSISILHWILQFYTIFVVYSFYEIHLRRYKPFSDRFFQIFFLLSTKTNLNAPIFWIHK